MQFIDLKAQYELLKDEINDNIQTVLNSGQYMMGDFVKQLEKELAEYTGSKYCVTCANGTDALSLALMVWGVKEGDAVFVPSFTFYSTAEVVSLLGATPIFVDTDPRTFNIDTLKLEKAIQQVEKDGKLTPKVIIPVDLFGQPADFSNVLAIAKQHNLLVLEDAAQGFGGSIDGKMAGSFGDISTTSFFPAKPLGCYGDGGAIFTDNKEYYDLLVSLRVHGKGTFKYDNVRVGMNSRLDTIQAGILLPKLHAFKDYELKNRNEFAKMYTEQLKDIVITPIVPSGMISSWAQYTIMLSSKEERDTLQIKLKEEGIPTMVYYPKPLHQQTVYMDYKYNLEDLTECERISNCVLSLPMHPYLTKEIVVEISSKLRSVIQEIRNEG
ncbi:MAG: DegT/DnrJ/EryC1/StrS aminotransferase family protein [Erysipelotrichaceae bacterium]